MSNISDLEFTKNRCIVGDSKGDLEYKRIDDKSLTVGDNGAALAKSTRNLEESKTDTGELR